VAEEDVENGKPDPEGFLTGARQLRRRPSDILVFEDSVPGVRAALAARMKCIAVSTDPTPELLAVAPAIVTGLSAHIVSDGLLRH
jgi:beta-phosphoglucomutase-like phosphatase (HAD superfamily)